MGVPSDLASAAGSTQTRPAKGIYLDVLLIDRLAGREVALELKYLTASWQGVARLESFDLLSQGAQDIRAYDCIKDISRVERFVYDRLPEWRHRAEPRRAGLKSGRTASGRTA